MRRGNHSVLFTETFALSCVLVDEYFGAQHIPERRKDVEKILIPVLL